MTRISVITSLFRCRQYLEGFLAAVEEIENKQECEFLLVFNDPTPDEEAVVLRHIEGKPWYRYTRVPREPLYATWNRAVRMARGQYLANWNVDDHRTPDSLRRQADMLDAHPEAAMTYGDTVRNRYFGKLEGPMGHEPEYTEQTAPRFRHCCHCSCFPMWRREVHDVVGYFDEQFRLVGDFEFQIRLAYHYGFVKTPGLLGYYLCGGGGTRLSQQSVTHAAEDNMVYLRYGHYPKANIARLHQTLRLLRPAEVKCGEEWIPIERYIPGLRAQNRRRRWGWLRSLCHLPVDLARYIKIDILRIPTRTYTF